MRFFVILISFISFSATCYISERINGTSLNRLDIIEQSVSDVALSEIDHFIVPEDWQMFFEDNSYRGLKVSANRGQGWHEAFDQIGKKLLLTILIDGSTKFVVIAKPFAEFSVGAQIINMKAISYANNIYLDDVFKRAQVNELNYQNEKMRAQFKLYEQKKIELTQAMDNLKREQDSLKSQSEKLKSETQNAMARQQRQQSEIDRKISSLKNNDYRDSQFVFYAAQGLVKSNIKQLAEKIGYSDVKFDERIPSTCDWPQEKKETLKGVSGEAVMDAYLSRFSMTPNTIQNTLYLTFHGPVEGFKNCSGIF